MGRTKIDPVFDYRALRLLLGLIAFSLPMVVTFLSSRNLSSISASYHTEARDVFVGMLFIVGTFLFAYNGHTTRQAVASKVTSITAFLVAVFPTSCDSCTGNLMSSVHYISAATLFLILAGFCFGPFQAGTRGRGGKKGIRSKFYYVCGGVMIACLVIAGGAEIMLSDETIRDMCMTFWAEAIALGAFGVAWFVSGKSCRCLADRDEALRLLR